MASSIRWAGDSRDRGATLILDPCAGNGVALAWLVQAWRQTARALVRAVGLEGDPAAAHNAGRKLRATDPLHQVIAGDPFRVQLRDAGRVALLYLCPDRQRAHAAEWLARFLPVVDAGGGLLAVLTPAEVAESAELLAAACSPLDLFTFGDALPGHLLARGRRRTGLLAAGDVARLRELAGNSASLPLVGSAPRRPLALDLGAGSDYFAAALAPVDLVAVLDHWRPLADGAAGGDLRASLARVSVSPCAMPPKPAHVALALATGAFNGITLQPNADAPPDFPPVLAKGRYGRQRVTLSERPAANGTPASAVEAERPRFELQLLRQDTWQLVEPSASAELTGAHRLEDATVADVVVGYSGALAAVMAERFPALVDPTKPEHLFALADVGPRRLYQVQGLAVRASLQLLARAAAGLPVQSEVGTGKTTVAGTLLGLLSPRHHAATEAALQTAPGCASLRLPLVRRALVQCPPHLVEQWRGELEAIVPGVRVLELRELGDERADADVYLLSREVAKLEGLAVGGWWSSRGRARCPRCGSIIADAEQALAKRGRCTATPRQPANQWAHLALQLAGVVITCAPWHEPTRELLGGDTSPAVERAKAVPPSKRPGDAPGTAVRQLVAAVLELAAAGPRGQRLPRTDRRWSVVFDVVRELAHASPGVRPWVRDHLVSFAARARTAGAELSGRQQGPSALAMQTAAALGSGSASWSDAHVTRAAERLADLAEWHEPQPCGEPLWQATGAVAAGSSRRRYPLASYLIRRARDRFDLAVIDEAHEANNLDSAQSQASHRLAQLDCPVLLLTGSAMGGYASSLYGWWSVIDPEFRREFPRSERSRFLAAYGLAKFRRSPPKGSPPDLDRSQWSEAIAGEAPGIDPRFILRYLLRRGIMMHKADLDVDLPAAVERPYQLQPSTDDDRRLLAGYFDLEAAVVARVEADRGSEFAGKLWGAVCELPAYVDHATADHGPWEVRYPENVGGGLVAVGAAMPESYRTPKERWLLAYLRHRLAEGHRVLVFVRHTGERATLPLRLVRLIRGEVTRSVDYVSSRNPPPRHRGAHLERLVALGNRVLVVNPAAVRTGLNCLVAYSCAVWYETPTADAALYVQANGRIHRIGQRRPTEVAVPLYTGTGNADLLQLTAAKVSAAWQVDGLSLQGGLEAAGAGEGERLAVDSLLAVGEAVYRRMLGRVRAAQSAETA